MKSKRQARLVVNLAVLSLVAEFLLSENVLAWVGIPYGQEGGPLIAKLHPGTYLAASAMIVRLAQHNDPLPAIWQLMWRDGGLAIYIGAILFCILFEALMTGAGGLGLLLDSFLTAGMVAVALADLTALQAARVAAVLRALLLINATIALAEIATGKLLLPFDLGAGAGESDYRAVALYDHPLTGAAATMVGLLLSPDAKRMPMRRLAYRLWMFLALASFGGRIAFALAAATAIGQHSWHLLHRAFSRSLTPVDFRPIVLVTSLALPLAVLAMTFGVASRLLAHLYWDPSAATRVAQFHLLQWLRPEQLLFGCRREDMIALLEPVRLAYNVDAIENFWLVAFISLGMLGFPVFVLGLAALIAWLWRRGDAAGRVMTASLFLAASTSNSLGHKSPLLVMLVGAVLARAPLRAPGPARNTAAPVQPPFAVPA